MFDPSLSWLRLSFVDSVRFPFNYTFIDKVDDIQDHEDGEEGRSKILSEVSACRFVNDSEQGKNHNDKDNNNSLHYRLLLVGDSGEVFTAQVTLWRINTEAGKETLRFNITLERQRPLLLPGYNVNQGATDMASTTPVSSRSVDAEGCEVFDTWPHAMLVSSEHPLALTWFDPHTGWAATTNNVSQSPLPQYRIPTHIAQKTRPNKGFEAVTAWSSPRMPTVVEKEEEEGVDNRSYLAPSYVLTTTEGHLRDDPPGFHRWLLWKTDKGGDPILEMGHWASRWKGKLVGDNHEFLSITDLTYWPEQELLLVLERGYDGETNMISLSSVDMTFPMSRPSQSLLNWTLDTMFLASSAQESIQLPVDNYESLCLLPSSATQNNPKERLVLLVNDENHNPQQIGTQFVLLRLHVEEVDDGSLSKQHCLATRSTLSSSSLVLVPVLLVLGGLVLVAVFQYCRRMRDYGSSSRGQYKVTTNASTPKLPLDQYDGSEDNIHNDPEEEEEEEEEDSDQEHGLS